MELLAENADEVSAHARALGWMNADESILNLDAAGEGNMNRTLRADLGSRSIILKQSVPYVAKYPQIAAPENRIAVEASFYQAIKDHRTLSMRVPRVLGYDPLNRLLCLQDLGASQDFSDMYTAAPDHRRDEPLDDIINWLAALHALPITPARLPDGLGNESMRELNHAHIFEIPLDPDNGLALAPGLLGVAAEFAADDELKAQTAWLGELYLGRQRHTSAEVLLHGDFYPGSWLRNATAGACIIDPEFAFVGAPEFDVGVLMAHLILCGYEQPHLARLMHNYVEPPGFDNSLAFRFAGIEIIRRLLGVAQLPLAAGDTTKLGWLAQARALVLAATPARS